MTDHAKEIKSAIVQLMRKDRSAPKTKVEYANEAYAHIDALAAERDALRAALRDYYRAAEAYIDAPDDLEWDDLEHARHTVTLLLDAP